MSTRSVGLFVAVVMVCVIPRAAEARFGKHSNHGSSSESSSDSSSSDSGSKSDSKSNSTTHKAVPATAPSPSYGASSGSPTYSPGEHHSSGHSSGRRHHRGGYYVHPRYETVYDDYYFGWGFGYYPYFAAPAPPPSAPMEVTESSSPTSTIGVDGLLHNQKGTMLGMQLAFEGRRFGINSNFSAIFAPVDATSREFDVIKLLDAHLTYALLAGAHGRLRLEAGINAAFGEDIAFLGPDGGVSMALALIGPLGVEASAHLTPYPHQRFDALAGVTVGLGPIGFRAGWRVLYLNDRGYVNSDGTSNTDTFHGPFLGLAIAL